ncbi:SSI family serine proteinase inhibitor [Saccharothrix variisporea]|nr:SSI family serine proteinase inhibitor [Saccharothrix variisporea]
MAPLPVLAAMAAFVPVAVTAPDTTLNFTTTRAVAQVRMTNLTCDPAGGSHPDAEAACKLLSDVDGDLNALEPEPGIACTMQYDPVTVRVSGRWRGKSQQFSATYENSCVMHAHTGPLFDF